VKVKLKATLPDGYSRVIGVEKCSSCECWWDATALAQCNNCGELICEDCEQQTNTGIFCKYCLEEVIGPMLDQNNEPEQQENWQMEALRNAQEDIPS